MTNARSSRGSLSGFTLVELLVVIGIIALLISVLMPMINRARAQAIKTQCSANLKNLGAAFIAYANENRGSLPINPGGANWIWDWSYQSRDNIMKCGAVRSSFYCPDNGALQNSDDKWWFSNSGVPQTQIKGVTVGTPNGFSVLGYNFLIRRSGGLSALVNHRFYQDSLKPTYDSKDPLCPRVSTDVEIVTEAVFLDSQGMLHIKGALDHFTPHVNRGKPEGGNILYLDGHVSWRAFTSMELHWQSGADVLFYW